MTSSDGNIFRLTGQMSGEFTGHRSLIFFVLCLNKRLSKQWWGWWSETLSHPLWCRCNVIAKIMDDGIKHTAHQYIWIINLWRIYLSISLYCGAISLCVLAPAMISAFMIAWCCQPHWMGHRQHLNLKQISMVTMNNNRHIIYTRYFHFCVYKYMAHRGNDSDFQLWD